MTGRDLQAFSRQRRRSTETRCATPGDRSMAVQKTLVRRGVARGWIDDEAIQVYDVWMSKYEPLTRYLRRQSADKVDLTFRGLEILLKAMLPRGASEPEWWANEAAPKTRYAQRLGWLNAGFNAALIQGKEQVRFTRRHEQSDA